VGDHRGDKDLAGSLRYSASKLPQTTVGIREEGDLFEKLIVTQGLPPYLRRRLLGLIADDPFPFVGIDDDGMPPRLGKVLLGAADGKRAGAHEIYGAARVAAFDVSDRQGNDWPP